MSTIVELPESQWTIGLPTARTDEVAWQAWIGKSRARERRNNAKRIMVVKLISTTVLLGAAALWTDLSQFHIVIRFLVAIGGVVVMYQAFYDERYAIAALFGALTLLYNPVVPTFDFAGEWQRVVVAASSIPFISSLVWRAASRT